MVSRAVADPGIAARHVEQHEGKVLGPHRGLDMVIDVVCADDAFHDACAELGFPDMIDGWRVGAREMEIDLAPHGGG